ETMSHRRVDFFVRRQIETPINLFLASSVSDRAKNNVHSRARSALPAILRYAASKLLYACRLFACTSVRQHSYSNCSFACGRPPGVRSKRAYIGSAVPTCRGSCFGSVGMNNSSEAQLNLITPSGPL